MLGGQDREDGKTAGLSLRNLVDDEYVSVPDDDSTDRHLSRHFENAGNDSILKVY